MPVASSSWADEVEEESGTLPPPSEVYENGFKVLTEYKLNEDNKKVKVVRTYKIEKCIVSKTIAKRKAWAKIGDSKDDRPGPNPASTIIAEDVFLQFISSKEEDNKAEEDPFRTMKEGKSAVFKCRKCNGDHWTIKCPYKDTVLGADEKKAGAPGLPSSAAVAEAPKIPGQQGSKYVPPSMRDGGNKRGESMQMQRRDDTTAIRISNLSESTTDADLEDLVKPFGVIQKLFLAKEKQTNLCKGFAYVHFRFRAEAAKAIERLHGFGYDHLILNVDWSKPQTPST